VGPKNSIRLGGFQITDDYGKHFWKGLANDLVPINHPSFAFPDLLLL